MSPVGHSEFEVLETYQGGGSLQRNIPDRK